MRLLLELALTHVLGRGRQTVVAGIGVALASASRSPWQR